MTQEETMKVWTDLSARVMYHPKIRVTNTYLNQTYDEVLTMANFTQFSDVKYEVKPYLRPMSSMTDEEKKILWEELDKDMDILDSNLDAPIVNVYKGRCYRGNPVYHEIDFLNKNHFDWRGLIPMGLAFDHKEEIRKTV
jgi:hypothetical protein